MERAIEKKKDSSLGVIACLAISHFQSEISSNAKALSNLSNESQYGGHVCVGKEGSSSKIGKVDFVSSQ